MNWLAIGLVASSLVPQTAVIPSVGCGSGCRYEIRQIGRPEHLDDGWVRVQVERTQRFYDRNGNERTWRGIKSGTKTKGWNFAECTEKRFASGNNSNRIEAWERSIFDSDGRPSIGSVMGAPHPQWEALCTATADMRRVK